MTTELSKENDKLKKSTGEATDGETKTTPADGGGRGSDGLMEELQVVRSERDRAVREEKTLRQSLSLLEHQTEVHFTHSNNVYVYIFVIFVSIVYLQYYWYHLHDIVHVDFWAKSLASTFLCIRGRNSVVHMIASSPGWAHSQISVLHAVICTCECNTESLGNGDGTKLGDLRQVIVSGQKFPVL